jgi:hypothetical protein
MNPEISNFGTQVRDKSHNILSRVPWHFARIPQHFPPLSEDFHSDFTCDTLDGGIDGGNHGQVVFQVSARSPPFMQSGRKK